MDHSSATPPTGSNTILTPRHSTIHDIDQSRGYQERILDFHMGALSKLTGDTFKDIIPADVKDRVTEFQDLMNSVHPCKKPRYDSDQARKAIDLLMQRWPKTLAKKDTAPHLLKHHIEGCRASVDDALYTEERFEQTRRDSEDITMDTLAYVMKELNKSEARSHLSGRQTATSPKESVSEPVWEEDLIGWQERPAPQQPSVLQSIGASVRGGISRLISGSPVTGQGSVASAVWDLR